MFKIGGIYSFGEYTTYDDFLIIIEIDDNFI